MESRHEQPNQPRFICALDHIRAVGIEFVIVEVAVGVCEFQVSSSKFQGEKSRLIFGGGLANGLFSDFVFCFLFANLFVWDKCNQRPQGIVDAFRVGEVGGYVSVQHDGRAKMLDGNSSVLVVDADCMSLLHAEIIFSAHAFFASEIIFSNMPSS